jgi:hypothetical protein
LVKHAVGNLGGNGADTPIVALIKGTDGVPVYKLECHTGEYDSESEINFSGDYGTRCKTIGVGSNERDPDRKL